MILITKYDDFDKKTQTYIKAKISENLNHEIGLNAERLTEKEVQQNTCFEVTKATMGALLQYAYYRDIKITDTKTVFKDIMRLANKRKMQQYQKCKHRHANYEKERENRCLNK